MTPRKEHEIETDIITLIKGQVCVTAYLALVCLLVKNKTDLTDN